MLGASQQASNSKQSKMATASNSKQILSSLLDEVVALRKEIAELKSTKTSMGSGASKARKPRDPDAPKKAPNAWILFTGRVREALKAAGKPAGKEAQQFASHLKNSLPEGAAYELTAEEIMAEHPSWVPPPPKPKEEKEEAEEEAKPKPKKVYSPEEKAALVARLQAGKKAKAAARKAAEEAAKAADEGEVEEDEAEAELSEAEVPSPKAAPPPPAPKALKPLPYKGKRLLLDPETNGTWERNEDGSKGKWMGLWDPKAKSINAAAAEV